MKVAQFVSHLNRLNVKLALDGQNLRYKAPKGTMTPALRAEIVARKAEIQRFLRQANQTVETPIVPAARTTDRPLSLSQERLWFLAQLEGASAAYNLSFGWSLAGKLDVAAFEWSLDTIVQRHEVLRTTFRPVQGQVRLQINSAHISIYPKGTMSQVALDRLPPDRQEAEVQRLAEQEVMQPFDLVNGPLWRTTLVRLAEAHHLFLVTFHHTIFDGWSLGIFTHELSVLYEARLNGKASPLPPLDIQYADFAVWQRTQMTKGLLDEQLAYWKTQLADAPALLALPTDHPRPAVQRYQGGHHAFVLHGQLTEQLKQVSQKMGVTLFMLLEAAFAVLLARYTRQDDILIGTTIANRQRKEIEPLLGFFTNMLVLRNDLSGNPAFSQFLAKVRQMALDAYQYQAMSFEQLVEALQPERSLSHNPLFQVIFNLQESQDDLISLPMLTVTPFDQAFPFAKFDLSLIMRESKEGMLGWWEYNIDLFEGATIERLVGHFQMLLRGIVNNPDQTIAELPLLTPAERQQILIDWNDTQACAATEGSTGSIDYPANKCIHQLFEEQVERTPDATAVVFGEQELSYRELNARANQLAHYLIKQGVGPEVLVGICVERSIEMVVGLLAILKAGGAYVPLDPAYPHERLQFMLEDAQIQVLLTQRKLRKVMQAFAGTQFELDTLPATATTNPIADCCSNNLAYVLFTSGSTGRPKGVAIEHRSAVALLHWAGTVFAEEKRAGILASTTISFDLSVFEMFFPLINGGRMILAENVLDLPNLNDVTLVNTVPSAMKELVRTGRLPASVRVVNLAGEPLKNRLVQQIYQQSNVERVYNLYGPSEDTTYSTYTLVEQGRRCEPTIGRPIVNTQAYILDRHRKPTPIGVPGELYLGGDGLARGYLNRPELTNEKFVTNSFSTAPTARLYRTGDLCRYLPDGNIEFLGRIDHQVKVRGFRIELGEIEAVLAQHPDVQETVVVVREESEDKRLVAYLVGTERLNNHTLHTYLAKNLPHYMLPSAFVQLEAMPLTPNGKINRRALPTPDYGPDAATLVRPRTPTEEDVAAIWREVLKLEQVGVHDDFFMMGGHSLLVTQLIFQLQQRFGISLPLRTLFETPTVAGLAKTLSAARTVQTQAEPSLNRTAPTQPAEAAPWIPLLPTQIPLIPPETAVEKAYVNSGAHFSIHSEVNIVALQGACQALATRHEALRLRVAQRNGMLMLRVHPDAVVPFQMVEASGWSQEEVAEQITALWHFCFDLEQESPIRVTLFTRAPDDHILVLLIHHIANDGWSMQVIREELPRLYQAQVTGADASLPTPPWSFTDYLCWHQETLSGAEGEHLWQYWQQQLSGTVPVLNLPTDYPRPAVTSHRGAGYEFCLASDLTQQLRQLAKRQGVPLHTVMQAAFHLLLHQISDQDDILVGMTVNNRVRPELHGVIGSLVDVALLRSFLVDDLNFTAYLGQVRESVLGALAHQGYPSALLAERLGIQPDAGQPLVQVSLNYFHAEILGQHKAHPAAGLDELVLTPSDLPVPMIGNWEEDFILAIFEEPDRLRGGVRYNTDLFKETTIATMMAAYQTLLEQIVDDSAQSIVTLLQQILREQTFQK